MLQSSFFLRQECHTNSSSCTCHSAELCALEITFKENRNRGTTFSRTYVIGLCVYICTLRGLLDFLSKPTYRD